MALTLTRLTVLALTLASAAEAWLARPVAASWGLSRPHASPFGRGIHRVFGEVTSPFEQRLEDMEDDDGDEEEGDFEGMVGGASQIEGPLDLNWDNVDLILDEMRPYLISDGGNVVISEIDGPVVKLELQGACGSCPSSTMTMKMGLERRLKEAIPEISEVVQAMPDSPPLTEESVDGILEGIRPFLQVAGGKIEIESLTGVDSIQPQLVLKMTGASSSIQSVKLEIMQRIQRFFMISGLRIDFV
mmetsp:Transcript_39432/g.106433  ORF Transcript_39432/g.106433 Transcript_39432/m.106433 type:complete len:245 (-) Transcript_39432:1381-2115(-)